MLLFGRHTQDICLAFGMLVDLILKSRIFAPLSYLLYLLRDIFMTLVIIIPDPGHACQWWLYVKRVRCFSVKTSIIVHTQIPTRQWEERGGCIKPHVMDKRITSHQSHLPFLPLQSCCGICQLCSCPPLWQPIRNKIKRNEYLGEMYFFSVSNWATLQCTEHGFYAALCENCL